MYKHQGDGELEKELIVFVYGTLRKSEDNHWLLKEAKLINHQSWTNGVLYDSHLGYPIMTINGGARVYGEIYQVNPTQLKRLDDLLGFGGEDEVNYFDRTLQTVYTDFDELEAYVYVMNVDEIMNLEVISLGDWKSHQYLCQEELLYFAYGSCMDDQRFKEAGVGAQFSNVVGCGVASHFSLAYTRKLSDGGRADLIVSEESAEGKVYHIKNPTLAYLFEREGVTTKGYRPAFIDIEIEGVLYTNVLTFLVVHKEDETAPPKHYATELLRGAKGCVSDAYFNKLKDDLAQKFGIHVVVRGDQ